VSDWLSALLALVSYLACTAGSGILFALDEGPPDDEKQAREWAGTLAWSSLIWPVTLLLFLAIVCGEKYKKLLTRIIIRPIRHQLALKEIERMEKGEL